MKDSLNIAIAGATGYVGLELIKILSKHPKAKILYLCANKSAGKKIYGFDKKIIKKNLPKISKIENINWDKINILFTALPNGEAQKIAKQIPNNIKLIDLSYEKFLNVIGFSITNSDIKKILSSLGCKVKAGKKSIKVLPPSWRPDLKEDIDLIEELVRIKGYSRIPLDANHIFSYKDQMEYLFYI